MIVVAPIAQIAPIVNGLTDFRINGLTNGMVGWGLRAVRAVKPITAAGKVRAVRLGIEAIVCIDDIEGWGDNASNASKASRCSRGCRDDGWYAGEVD